MNRRPYPHPDVTRLLDVGRPNGPSLDEAMALFQRIRRSPHEARALEELTFRQDALPLPDPLLVAAASAMIDRGETTAAIAFLRAATSAPALMLRADLEAERGDASAALALVERVLLRDIEHPGARERHQRFRESLGIPAFGPERARQDDPKASTWLANEPDTPYVLHREVARGGAGVVYEAEDRDLGRSIALKIYHDPHRQRDQLLHEARVASALAGPGVVRIFDVDPDHGWIALAWARRGALRDRIRVVDRDVLFPIESWALPLAHTLARVHDAGWLHLDVKPANVLFDDHGAPLLTDFGIARRNGEPPVAGSLGYVSPERLAGAPSAPSDDVYGFGRLIEDALQALNTPELFARWRPLVAACMAPRDERLGSAKALAQAMAELKAD
ncbi:protein kinase [Pendulispora rubella]|uniref:Protein kinase n=1 Tax=Pendulispora rubella TaxID=2741070 RepID=A0ABZ2L9W2_9BACT